MWKKLGLVLLSSVCLNTAQAAISILGTRIVYPSDKKSVSVELSNIGELPSLVQAWIDNGDMTIAPSDIRTPFVITPPLSRVDPKKGQTLRLTFTGADLPTDRESIFYFNALDIPPKPKQDADGTPQNYIQIAVRTRIKLFYRPAGLKLPPKEAYQQVTWKLVKQGKQTQLIANNPSPYYITYHSVKVAKDKQQWDVVKTEMIAPFSQHTFVLPTATHPAATTVKWGVINDYGGVSKGESSLSAQ